MQANCIIDFTYVPLMWGFKKDCSSSSSSAHQVRYDKVLHFNQVAFTLIEHFIRNTMLTMGRASHCSEHSLSSCTSSWRLRFCFMLKWSHQMIPRDLTDACSHYQSPVLPSYRCWIHIWVCGGLWSSLNCSWSRWLFLYDMLHCHAKSSH